MVWATRWLLVGGAAGIAVVSGASVRVGAQQTSGHAHVPAPTEPAPGEAPGGPRRVSEDELHRHGGVPRGWKFSLAPGDAGRGRELFRELECYKCHEIKTETFPAPVDGKYVGPELTGMGRIHPAEYIAESIASPNAVIVDEPGHTGPDGLSRMPSYADVVSLAQWLDLVAYLKGLTEGGEHPEGHGIERVATASDYRIRLVYVDGGHDGHGDRAGRGAPAPRAGGHLMAFITERESGEAIPYLPVMATVHGPGTARRTITLRPMISDGGFHYGADVVLPEQVQRLTLAIGPTTIRVSGSAKERFSKPATAVFDWSGTAK
jgi:uncharacterized protein involved in high-affinity Fe2+ transport